MKIAIPAKPKLILKISILLITSLVLFYALAGFIILPKAISYYLTHQFSEKAKYSVQIGDVHFNPYRFDFSMIDFKISDKNKHPLMQFATLSIDYDPKTIFEKKIILESIQITKPLLTLSIDAEGKSELFQLIENITATDQESTDPTPAFLIKKVQISKGFLDFSYQQFVPHIKKQITLNNLSLLDFHSTDIAHSNRLTMDIEDETKGTINLAMVLRLEPLAAQGEVAIKELQLQDILKTVESLKEYAIEPLLFDFSTRFSVIMNKNMDVDLNDTNINLTGLTLKSDKDSGMVVKIPEISMGAFSVVMRNSNEVKVEKGNVKLSDLTFTRKKENGPLLKIPKVKMQNFSIQVENSNEILVKNGSVFFHDIMLFKNASTPHLVKMSRVKIGGINADLTKKVSSIKEMLISDADANVLINSAGQVNLLLLADEFTAVLNGASNVSNTPPVEVAPAMNLTIEKFNIEKSRMHVRNENLPHAIEMDISPANVSIAKFKPLEPKVPFPLELQFGMPSASEMKMSAIVELDSMQADGTVSFKNFPLSLGQEFVDDVAYVDIENGRMDNEFAFSMNAKEAIRGNFSGNMAIRDFKVRKKNSKKKLMSWEKLAMEDMHFSLPENKLMVKKLTIDKPYGRLTINAAGATNIDDLMVVKKSSEVGSDVASPSAHTAESAKSDALESPVALKVNPAEDNKQMLVTIKTPTESIPSAQNASPGNTPISTIGSSIENDANQIENVSAKDSAPTAPPLQFDIAEIFINEAEMGFSDLTFKPSFRVAMKQLTGNIKGLSSDPLSRATVDLHGKVDRYAPVDIVGVFNVLIPKPVLDMNVGFKKIDLKSFTPYSGMYAGYVIDKGDLSLDLHYSMVNDKIEGTNHIVINKLKFGDKVKSDKATSLPLKLAIAILRDENGVIDLGFRVNGDVNNPQFSVGDVVLKAMKDVILKAVKAPFKLFANLFKSEEKKIQELDFDAGSDVINEAISKKLEVVIKALTKKKKLILNIAGNASLEEDKPVMQELALIEKLEAESGINKKLFLPAANPSANDSIYAIIAKLYKAQRAEDISDLEDRIAEDMSLKGDAGSAGLIKNRTYKDAWETLVDNTLITQTDVNALALSRAKSVQAYILAKQTIKPERVVALEEVGTAAPSLTTHLTLDAK